MLVFLCLKVKFQIQPIIFNRTSIPIMRVPRISILKIPIRRPTWMLRKNSLLFSWGKRHVCVWIEAVNYSESEDKLIVPTKIEIACIEPGLAIPFLYDIIHVSMPFFQIIPPSPSPSPTESKRLFYTSVSLLLSHI